MPVMQAPSCPNPLKPVTTFDPAEWGSAHWVASLLGINLHRVKRLAAEGLLGTYKVPGSHTWYRQSNVYKLARKAVTPIE